MIFSSIFDKRDIRLFGGTYRRSVKEMLKEDFIKQAFIHKLDNEWIFVNLSTNSSWTYIINNAPYVPVDYSANMLTYQKAYVRSKYEQVIDLSVIMQNNGVFIGAWPVSLILHNGECWFSTFEKEVFPPLFTNKTTSKTKKNASEIIEKNIKKHS